MSNHLAIATVTETLKNIVQTAVVSSTAMTGAKVTAGLPSDKIKESRVNIYLYEVKPNPFLRNQDLAPGFPPAMAINLNYLLSFYGDETKQEPQRLMGRVISAIHAEPTLNKQTIKEVIAATEHITNSNLDASVEDITLTPSVFLRRKRLKYGRHFRRPLPCLWVMRPALFL